MVDCSFTLNKKTNINKNFGCRIRRSTDTYRQVIPNTEFQIPNSKRG